MIPLGSLFAVFIFLALWVEPIEGDLTRLGGFMENDFGWNEPQQQFSSMLFKLEGNRKYNRYFDIVVLGDSFSNAYPRAQWQNYFVRATGLSLVTYKVDDIDIESFVASPAYRDHPPRIVIYETVERSFIGRATAWDKGDCKPAPFSKPPWKPLSQEPGNQPTFPHSRDTRAGLFHPNLSSGAHFLKRSIKKVFNKKSHQAINIALSRSDLFSNRQSGQLLVYRNDFERYRVSKQDLNRAVCGLTHIQNTFQKNGKTFFVGMIAPDKLTVYMDVYKNFDREKINWMDEIEKHPQLHVPRLDVALQKEIALGVQDVYLPNDTHWGSAGHKITAETLYRYLLEQGAIIPKKGNQLQNLP